MSRGPRARDRILCPHPGIQPAGRGDEPGMKVDTHHSPSGPTASAMPLVIVLGPHPTSNNVEAGTQQFREAPVPRGERPAAEVARAPRASAGPPPRFAGYALGRLRVMRRN